MATNVILQQPVPFSQSKPTQIVHEQPKSLDVAALRAQQPLTPTYNLGGKGESQCTDKDITTNESESESDQEEDEDEEDKVRRDASLPTILLPKPKRKPPFTIEGAMNSILKRNKKTEKEAKLDNVRFQKDEENMENEESNKDANQLKEEANNEDNNFFSFFSNGNKNNNKNDNEDNVAHNCDGKKKKSSFSFTKLGVNLNKTNNQTVESTDNENNNPSNANDNDQANKNDDDPRIDLLETVQGEGNEYSNASPRHNTHNKFESMEQRREARLMKFEKEGKKGVCNDILIDTSHIHGNIKEFNGNVIPSPAKEVLLKQERNNMSNSSTTSRESLNNAINKPYNPPESLNNRITSRFKKPWRKSKKSALPPPPPTNAQGNGTQVTNPTVHNFLPNGYAVGASQGKQEAKTENADKHQKRINSSTNEILLAGIDEASSDQQIQRDDTRLDSVEPQEGKNSYEIIGTRRDVLDEELLVDLRDLDQIKANENKIPEDREPFPMSPLQEERRQSKQVTYNNLG